LRVSLNIVFFYFFCITNYIAQHFWGKNDP
jgi:hypothetical protein